MKIFGSFFFFVLFCTLSAFGQTNLTLSGILVDKANHEPVLSGSVALLHAKDSTYVDGNISNAKGEFSFQNLKTGNYILKVTYVGYYTLFKNVSLTGKIPVTNLGELQMTTNDVLLKEAVVEGKRPEVSVKEDTVEYDAQSYKAGENAVVEDLLKKLPGLEVDQSGNVTAQGKAVNKVYVNGKEFFRDDPKIATQNIPADIIDKVQVYDRKSDLAQMTGFDTGDEETVMNLTVRAGMMQGTTGVVQVGAGQDVKNDNDFRYSENAFVRHQRGADSYGLITRINNTNNMGGGDVTGGGGGGGGRGGGGGGGFNTPGIAQAQNYMLNINKEFSQKLNVNGDIRFSNQSRSVNSDVTQISLSKLATQQEKINQDYSNFGKRFNTNFRIDWNPNKQNAFIISPTFSFNQTGQSGLGYDNRINLDNQSVLLDSKSHTSSHGNTFAFGGSMQYSFRFPKAGRVLSVSVSGNYNNNYSQPKNKTYYPVDSLDFDYSRLGSNQWSENSSLSNNISSTLSYVETLGHNNFVQLLYTYSYSETESKNSTYNILQDMGNYMDSVALIAPMQSRTVMRDAIRQRMGINFKADRKKFTLTFGFNVDPYKATNDTYQPVWNVLPPQLIDHGFAGKLPLIKGDSLFSSTPINVVNYSPTLNFRYIIDQRSSLRVVYDGTTNQPSADQLRDYGYVDINHPNDLTRGNPNLKPGYTNDLRIEFNKYVAKTQLMYSFRVNGSYVLNDIITVTQMQSPLTPQGKGNLTTYENINGNWNAALRGMINVPLSKKFSIGNSASLGLAADNSFVTDSTYVPNSPDNLKNIMRSTAIGDRLNLRLQLNDSLYFGTTGTINYNRVTYTATPIYNQKLYDYSWGANMMWTFLPGWIFDSDITRNWRSGYPAGYNNSQTIWNAAITKRLFKKQSGTGSVKLQIFDILQDRKNISASQSASNLQFSQTNVIPSYFMVSFIYRFSIFPKSSLLNAGDMAPQRGDRGGRGDGGGGRGGGFGGGRGGFGGGGGGFGGGGRQF